MALYCGPSLFFFFFSQIFFFFFSFHVYTYFHSYIYAHAQIPHTNTLTHHPYITFTYHTYS
ncbi:hypothetical protein PUN28_010764 [Cardiocondyla obscurior]|uniref:Secreted protein n=1 Tax=Cardiocondyla obscurior TaxID=286306 RepID=A0AAW2FK51_9HYME